MRWLSIVLICLACWALESEAAEDLEQLLERNVKALGGQRALDRVSAVVYSGTVTRGSRTLPFTWSLLPPSLFREDLELGSLVSTLAIEGKRGWRGQPNHVSVGLRGAERELFYGLSLLLNRAFLQADDLDLTLEPVETEAGRERAFKIDGRDLPAITCYFGGKSALLSRCLIESGQLTMTILFDQYRKAGKTKFPFRIVRTISDGASKDEVTYEADSVSTSGPIESDIFERAFADRRDFTFDGDAESAPLPFASQASMLPTIRIAVEGLEPFAMILDPGSTTSSLDDARIKALGLHSPGNVLALSEGRVRLREIFLLDSLDIGPLEMRSLAITRAAADLPVGDEGPPIAGILGQDVFDQLVVGVRYADRQVVFNDPAGYRDDGTGVALPLDDFGRISALLNRQSLVTFVVTTRSPAAVWLSSKIVSQSGPRVAPARQMPWSLLEPGDEKPTRWLLESVHVGEIVLTDVAAVVQTFGASGGPPGNVEASLGGPLLERFDVTFDYPRRQILLVQGPAFSRPFPFNRSGLVFSSDGGGTVAAVSAPAVDAIKKGDRVVAVMTGSGWSEEKKVIAARLQEAPETVLKLRIERNGKVKAVDLVLKSPPPGRK